MADPVTRTRGNQKQRTRKDLLQAASRLTKQGLRPSLEEVAAEAMVSRATAYRELTQLTEWNLLEKSGQGRATRYRLSSSTPIRMHATDSLK